MENDGFPLSEIISSQLLFMVRDLADGDFCEEISFKIRALMEQVAKEEREKSRGR